MLCTERNKVVGMVLIPTPLQKFRVVGVRGVDPYGTGGHVTSIFMKGGRPPDPQSSFMSPNNSVRWTPLRVVVAFHRAMTTVRLHSSPTETVQITEEIRF